MKRVIPLVAVISIMLSTVLAAQPTEEWVCRRSRSIYSSSPQANAMSVDDSGNVYVTGCNKESTSWYDIYTHKINSSGSFRWGQYHDGPTSYDDKSYGVAVDDSGNVYIAGYAYYTTSYTDDGILIKYNAAGSKRWTILFHQYEERFYDVVVDDSNYIYVAGYTQPTTNSNRNVVVAKYNTHGTQLWKREFNGPANNRDEAYDLTLDDEGYIYLTGRTYNDYLTLKYSPDGTLLWSSVTTLGEAATEIAIDGDKNVYVTGFTGGNYKNYLTVKYDSLGTELWTASYSGFGANVDSATAIGIDQTGNVYVTGRSVGEGTYNDYATVKYNTNGIQQWVARYNGVGNSHDYAYDLAVDNSGQIYVTGSSMHSSENDNYVTIKYDPSGNQQWLASYNYYYQNYNRWDKAKVITVDEDRNVYVTGESHNDFLTIKYSQPIPTDVGPVSIDAPTDTVWTGYAHTPQATVGNFETDPATFDVVCQFDSSGTIVYTDTVAVNNLAGSATQQVTFVDWTAGEGTYTMTVTTLLAGDGNPANDQISKTVISIPAPLDVGPVSIDSPTGNVWVGYSEIPQATIANFESETVSFNVVCQFDSSGTIVYTDTVTVTNLTGSDSIQVAFSDWTAGGILTYTMSVITLLDGDINPANDQISKSVTAESAPRDVAVVSIDAPQDTVWSEESYVPKATVANLFSLETASFDVICQFDSAGTVVYIDTVAVTNLAGSDSTQVSFASWTAGEGNDISYQMNISVDYVQDTEPGNDQQSKSVTALWAPRDVAPVYIITPPDFVWTGLSHIPRVIVANLWEWTESFSVVCRFDSAGTFIYTDSVEVVSLAGGDSIQVQFAPWASGAVDQFTYEMEVITLLEKDINPGNDRIHKSVNSVKAVVDIDIQDYSGNLSANTMELTGVMNSIVVGSYVMVNPDNWEKNVDLYDGPANVDANVTYSWTDLTTYGGSWNIPSSNINPDLNTVASIDLGDARQNIVQVYIPMWTIPKTYSGTVTASATGGGAATSDDFTLKVNVVAEWGGLFFSSFGGEPSGEGNQLYWTNFGFGEESFNIYRAEGQSDEFLKLNHSPTDAIFFTDHDVASESQYRYKLGLCMANGDEIFIGPLDMTSSVEVGTPILKQNWPNPWMETTEIAYFLPRNLTSASLKVFDASGKLVKTLAQGEHEPGAHSVTWNGTDKHGNAIASGVYFYRLESGEYQKTGKMLLLK